MDSINVFKETSYRDRARRICPLWLAVPAAAVVPGAGHLLLGEPDVSVRLALCALGALALTIGGILADLPVLTWIAARAIFCMALYSVVDTTVRWYEDPSSPRTRRPLDVGFANLVLYGAGYKTLGKDKVFYAALSVGIVAHVVGGWLHPWAAVSAEALLLGYAIHGIAAARRQQPLRLNKDVHNRPWWLIPIVLVGPAFWLTLLIPGWNHTEELQKGVHVRRDSGVAVEPFYHNPQYGLSLELPSGWTFSEGSGSTLIAARWKTDMLMTLSVGPKVPFVLDADHYVGRTLAADGREGFRDVETLELHESDLSTGFMGDPHAIELAGVVNDAPRSARIVTMQTRALQFVLWFEWGNRQQRFAANHFAHLLEHLEVVD